jgi:tetratricopeptide (TPR) repeat protein
MRGYSRVNVSARVRILALVSAACALAVAVVVGATLLQANEPEARAESARLQGDPPLVLDLAFRDDREARDLARAARLYDQGRRRDARPLFARYDSLQARVGHALTFYPGDAAARLDRLREQHPRSALVRLNLGLVRLWEGQRQAALAEWRAARRVEPDSLAAVRAGDLLFPQFARGLPTFIPSFDPGSASRLSLDELARLPGVRGKLLDGIALQRAGRPLSARRAFDAAVALEPQNVEALVAAAVARFAKPDPSPAFARLGPLARRFPRAATVRFHLGLLLLWMGSVDEAKTQLERARSLGPADPLAREANRVLRRLEEVEKDRNP